MLEFKGFILPCQLMKFSVHAEFLDTKLLFDAFEGFPSKHEGAY